MAQYRGHDSSHCQLRSVGSPLRNFIILCPMALRNFCAFVDTKPLTDCPRHPAWTRSTIRHQGPVTKYYLYLIWTPWCCFFYIPNDLYAKFLLMQLSCVGGFLGPSYGHVGCLFEPSWGSLVPSWGFMGPLGVILRLHGWDGQLVLMVSVGCDAVLCAPSRRLHRRRSS